MPSEQDGLLGKSAVPLLTVSAILVAGVTAYWTGLNQVENSSGAKIDALRDVVVALSQKHTEVAARQQVVFARLEKMETRIQECSDSAIRNEGQLKLLERLEGQVRALEQMLLEHNEITRRLPPLGKKSAVDKGWRPDG